MCKSYLDRKISCYFILITIIAFSYCNISCSTDESLQNVNTSANRSNNTTTANNISTAENLNNLSNAGNLNNLSNTDSLRNEKTMPNDQIRNDLELAIDRWSEIEGPSYGFGTSLESLWAPKHPTIPYKWVGIDRLKGQIKKRPSLVNCRISREMFNDGGISTVGQLYDHLRQEIGE